MGGRAPGAPPLDPPMANLSACHFLELEFDGGRNVFNVILTRLLLLFTGRIKRTVKQANWAEAHSVHLMVHFHFHNVNKNGPF